jgi:hypothetical protein
MKVLSHNDFEADYECDCGCQFHVDASTEENLFWDRLPRGLVPKCPECGRLHEV